MAESDETVFRISGDPSVSISQAEVDAQVAARAKLDERLTRDGKLRHLNTGEALFKEGETEARYRIAGRNSEDVRAGFNPNIREPDEESQQAAIREGNALSARIMGLQKVRPGTQEYLDRIPPAEEVIEVIGPKGAEGFGIVQRQIGTGPRAGEVIS